MFFVHRVLKFRQSLPIVVLSVYEVPPDRVTEDVIVLKPEAMFAICTPLRVKGTLYGVVIGIVNFNW